MHASVRNLGLGLIVLLMFAVFTLFQSPNLVGQEPAGQAVSFRQFIDLVDRGEVRAVDIDWPDIEISTIRGETFRIAAPADPTLVQRLQAKGVIITGRSIQPSQPR